jgi:hypothetical protein
MIRAIVVERTMLRTAEHGVMTKPKVRMWGIPKDKPKMPK